MTVNTWFKSLLVMLIFVIIANGVSHIYDIKQGAKEGFHDMDVYDIESKSSRNHTQFVKMYRLKIHFKRIETIMGRFDKQQRKTWERS